METQIQKQPEVRDMSESINELANALSKAQAVMESAIKDANNPFFKSKYADLASIWNACKKPLTDNQLCVVQQIGNEGQYVTMTTMLLHGSGQWIRSVGKAIPTKNDPQGLGSAATYLRRYGLGALVGVCTEDDDGNAASGNSSRNDDFNDTNIPSKKPVKAKQLEKAQELEKMTQKFIPTPDLICYDVDSKWQKIFKIIPGKILTVDVLKDLGFIRGQKGLAMYAPYNDECEKMLRDLYNTHYKKPVLKAEVLEEQDISQDIITSTEAIKQDLVAKLEQAKEEQGGLF